MHCPELSGLSDAWKKILSVPNEGSFPAYPRELAKPPIRLHPSVSITYGKCIKTYFYTTTKHTLTHILSNNTTTAVPHATEPRDRYR